MNIKQFYRRRSPRTRLVATVALVVAISGAVVTAAPAQRSRTRSQAIAVQRGLPRAKTRAHRREISAVPAGVRAHFALFRGREARRANALPAAVAEAFTGLSKAGVNPALSRAVQTPAGSVWVAPGSNVLCVSATGPGTGVALGAACADDSLAQRGDDYMLAGRAGAPTLLAGVVPDGVTKVVVTRADGSTTDLPVTANTFVTTTTGQFASISVDGTVIQLPQ
jgi:hypothetical protein